MHKASNKISTDGAHHRREERVNWTDKGMGFQNKRGSPKTINTFELRQNLAEEFGPGPWRNVPTLSRPFLKQH